MYTLATTLSEDIRNYETLIHEFQAGNVEPVKFKSVRVPMGIYEQRKDGTFMVRVRCAGGFITPYQLKQVALIARKYNSALLHITTRQEVQIQDLKLEDTVLVLQNLKEIGLAAKGGGGNTVRNIMASIESGISDNDVFDVLPYVFNVTTKLIAEPDSFTLPRKFKIAFSSNNKDTAYALFNDLGFVATEKNGQHGFKVFIGGSLGSKPMVGYELFEFAPKDDLLYIVDAAKKLFSRYGNRRNKHKARLRYVFYLLGKDKVFQLFHEIYNEVKKLEGLKYVHSNFEFKSASSSFVPLSHTGQEYANWKKRFVTAQKQPGLYSVLIPFNHGNVSIDQMLALSDFASKIGDDVIRFSMRQNLHLRNIPEEAIGHVFELVKSIGVKYHEPLIINNVVACTGADTCRLGICLSKGLSDAIQKKLIQSSLDLDKFKDVRINISGCPNSCGQQYAADFGFYGKVGRNSRMYPAYHIVSGGAVGADNAALASNVGEINARDLPQLLVDLFALYEKKSFKYKTFSQYIQHEGTSDIYALTEKYNDIPLFEDDKNYYFDWGADQIFSLAAKGVGECSAGLFDMIDVDRNYIVKYREALSTATDQEKSNLLYKIIFSSSRMLLITRGSEPKNEQQIFEEFTKHFIDSKLLSSIFKELVSLAASNKQEELLNHQEAVIELSEAVITLYENMDDSLQFVKGQENTSKQLETPKLQPSIRKKDFRGVACPMNFVKTKIELSSMNSGDLLEILLDDGEPIENVPGSIKSEGHEILDINHIDEYWQVRIKKA